MNIVTKTLLVSIATLASLLFTVLASGNPVAAQRARTNPSASSIKYLPASDAIIVVDVRRLINEALPGAVAGDPQKLAQINADITKFKTRTGVDPKSLERVVLSMHYTYPSPNITKVQTVAIASGTFDAKALIAAAHTAAGEKYREEKYRGTTISILGLNDQIKLAGLWDVRIHELGICVLDGNTLAFGSPENVRAAVVAGKAGIASNLALATLANRDPNALIGFGGNVTRALLDNLHVGTDAIAKDIGSIKQVYGSIGSTPTALSLLVVARTGSAAEAKSVSETVTGLEQLGAIFIARMQPPKKTLAQNALDNLKITTVGNEVQIRTQLATAGLAAFIK